MMTDHHNPLHLEEYIKALKESVPERDPRDSARGRAAFLAQADKRQSTDHSGWITTIRESYHSISSQFVQRRLAAATGLLLVVFLVIGALGGTVYAAQNSLPEQTLYSVKTFTEDIRLRYASQPEQKLQLLETLSQRRVDELSALSNQGQDIPSSALARMEQHTDTMLQISSAQQENELSRTLFRVRNILQKQQETLTKLARSESDPPSQALSRVQKKLHAKLALIEIGMEDPASFREKINGSHPLQPQATATIDKSGKDSRPEEKGKPEEAASPGDKGNQRNGHPPDENDKPQGTGTPQDLGKAEHPDPPWEKGTPEKMGPSHDKGKGKPDNPGPPPGNKKPDKGGPPEGKGKP